MENEETPWFCTPDQLETADKFVAAYGNLNQAFAGVDEPTMLAEIMPNDRTFTNPRVFGQFLMNNLGDCNSFNEDEKVYWLQVGIHMGPDWLNKLGRLVAFMKKTESFF